MKIILAALTVLSFLMILTPAVQADEFQRGARNQADSYYRMSRKAYRKAVNDYGNDFDKMPSDEKEKACTLIRRGLLYNRNNLVGEDIFRQRVVQKQIRDLRKYQLDLGCPNSEDNKKLKIGGSIQIGL